MVLSPDWSKYGGGPNSDVESVFLIQYREWEAMVLSPGWSKYGGVLQGGSTLLIETYNLCVCSWDVTITFCHLITGHFTFTPQHIPVSPHYHMRRCLRLSWTYVHVQDACSYD